MRKRRIVHEASLTRFPIFCNQLSSGSLPLGRRNPKAAPSGVKIQIATCGGVRFGDFRPSAVPVRKAGAPPEADCDRGHGSYPCQHTIPSQAGQAGQASVAGGFGAKARRMIAR